MVSTSAITLLLGPTNTGKTHRALERMLEHGTGMLGLPLRLLARELYDRVTTKLGEREVALVTGEERRVPPRPRYWICTVEAMPVGRDVEFVGVDEIQLVSHPERGHVFTDRLLHARGTAETWFMGSDAARSLCERLAPTARVLSFPRLSRLRSFGASTLAALPPRSAIVAFSADRVYQLAEQVRQRKGGAAVVLGALSPRARNAQVALYQSGEVDYLVATDAIGMGLNLDVLNVAFADVRKFDGKESRPLEAPELAQIAGRAGRYLNDGAFGVLAPLRPLPEPIVRAIEGHAFPQQRFAYFRSSDLDLSTVAGLLASLAVPPRQPWLKRSPPADDELSLRALSEDEEIRARVTTPGNVELLWGVCRIPNFRGLWVEDHSALLRDVFLELSGRRGTLSSDFLSPRVERLNDVAGDIESLLSRMAAIRSFTYIAQREPWVAEPDLWQTHTREIEDRLSDVLHERLMQRFVERGAKTRGPRARARPRRALPGEPLAEPPRDDHPFARLRELRDRLGGVSPAAATGTDFDDDASRVSALIDAPHEHFAVSADGRILAGERVLGRLTRGVDLLHPEVLVLLEPLGSGGRSRLQRRLVAFVRDWVGERFRSLRAPALDALTPAARGLAYQLERGLGTLLAEHARAQLDALTEADRAELLRLGVRIGKAVVYFLPLLEPAALADRAALHRAFHGRTPDITPGAGVVPRDPAFDPLAYAALGFPVFGQRAIRADLVAKVLRKRSRGRRRKPRATKDAQGS